MRLTFLLLSVFTCRVLDARDVNVNAVGFYILGANLNNLKHSMAQRIEYATNIALRYHGNDQHVYFVSGYKIPGKLSEAEHMENEILRIYRAALQPAPRIVRDDEARFTVMNFLKTIPLIKKENEQRTLQRVYMITSDYHIPRARAILQEFQNARLIGDVQWYVPSGAPHPRNTREARQTGRRFDKWLLFAGCCAKPVRGMAWLWYGICATCGNKFSSTGRANRDAILDPTRDQDNANIFASLCQQQRQSGPKRSMEETQLVERYLKNNKAITEEQRAEKKTQLWGLVKEFVKAMS